MQGSFKFTQTTMVGTRIMKHLLDYAKSVSLNSVQVYLVDGTYVLHAGEKSDFYWREPDAAGLAEHDLKLPEDYRAPQLVVETARTAEELTSRKTKPPDHLAHGSQQVWQVITGDRQIIVHQSGQPPQTYGLGDTVSGGDLLPGFTLEVAQVFGA